MWQWSDCWCWWCGGGVVSHRVRMAASDGGDIGGGNGM